MKHKITAPPVINHSGRKISATRKVRGLKYLWPVQKMKWCGCYQSRNKIWPRGSRSISWLDSWQGLNDNFIKQDKVNSAESELAVGFRLVSSLIWVYHYRGWLFLNDWKLLRSVLEKLAIIVTSVKGYIAVPVDMMLRLMINTKSQRKIPRSSSSAIN